jgi:hypothetical protein
MSPASFLVPRPTVLFDVRGHTLQCTAERGQPTTAELIGQHAAPTPAECSPAAAPDAGSPEASTPVSLPLVIFQSAAQGELQKVIKWLRKGGVVDVVCPTTTADGRPTTTTLLHTAAAYGHLEMVRELLKRGASVDLPSSLGGTALMAAANHCQLSIVLVLLQHSADPDLQDHSTPRPEISSRPARARRAPGPRTATSQVTNSARTSR